MDTTPTKADLVQRMRAERARWEALLAGQDEAHLIAPATIGTWSVKDVLAHLMAYQGEFLRAWNRVPRAAPPPDVDLADLEQRNAWIAARYRDWSLADVLASWRAIGDDLLARVEAANEEELRALVVVTPTFDLVPAASADAEGDRWYLADLIAGQACDHPGRHYPSVQIWLATGVRAALARCQLPPTRPPSLSVSMCQVGRDEVRREDYAGTEWTAPSAGVSRTGLGRAAPAAEHSRRDAGWRSVDCV